MATILDILERIRAKPGLFLGRPSASTLHAFLSGFALARKETDAGDYEFLAGFNRWVLERYKITSNQGWAKIIQFQSLTDDDEMNLFWKLFDEYTAQHAAKKKKVS